MCGKGGIIHMFSGELKGEEIEFKKKRQPNAHSVIITVNFKIGI